jgi:hypothetical protein
LTEFVINNEDATSTSYQALLQDLDTKFQNGWTILIALTRFGKPDNTAIFQTNAWTDLGTEYRVNVDAAQVIGADDTQEDGEKYSISFTLVPPELPTGTNDGDIAIYDGTAWTVLPPPASGSLKLSWTAASGVHWA